MPHSKSITIHRTDSDFEAFSWIASFVFFMVTHWKSPLTWAFLLLFGANVFSLQDYVRSDKARIETAKPISQNSFSIIPQAYAQEKPKPNGILIDGKLYGYFDPDVEAWKLAGKPTLLIHQKSSGAIFTIEVDALRPQIMKSFK